MEALEQVGMADFVDRPPHHLSFGQRRRVAVATVLAMEPEILVLDEPSSNLDPASRRELADILRGLDVTVLMVTHDLPYALELCPRSVVLSEGVVVADGATFDVLTDDALMRGPPAGAARAASIPDALIAFPRHGVGACRSNERRSSARSRRRAQRLASTIDQLAHRAQPEDHRRPPGDHGQGALRRPRHRRPRTDNILKVVGAVVGSSSSSPSGRVVR